MRLVSGRLVLLLVSCLSLATESPADNVVRVTNFPTAEDITILGSLHGTVYFATGNIGTSTSLYKIERGAVSAQSIGTFMTEGTLQRTITETAVLGNEIFFAVQDVVSPNSSPVNEIWKHSAGQSLVQLVKSIPTTGTFVGTPVIWSLNEFEGQLVFTSYFVDGLGQSDFALFTSDGSGAGTVPIDDPASADIVGPGASVEIENEFFFNTSVNNRGALCRFDGSEIVVVYVFDLNGTPLGLETLFLFGAGNRLYMDAFHSDLTKRTIWTSDGLSTSQPLITDGFDPDLFDLHVSRSYGSFQNFLFFAAKLPSQGPSQYTMWRTDGPDTEPNSVIEIVTSEFEGVSPGYHSLTVLNDTLYFSGVGNSGSGGSSLYMLSSADGDPDLVKDIFPGLYPAEFQTTPALPGSPGLRIVPTLDGRFVFQADDGTHGFEVWISDGSEAETMLLNDTQPGSGTSDPLWLTAAEDSIYFVADAGDGTGREVYRFEAGCIGSIRNADGRLVACFNDNGVLWLSGSFESNVQGSLSTADTLFVVYDDEDELTITIDSEGNMRTKGSLFEDQTILTPNESDRFMASNSEDVLSYVMRSNGDVSLAAHVLPAGAFI